MSMELSSTPDDSGLVRLRFAARALETEDVSESLVFLGLELAIDLKERELADAPFIPPEPDPHRLNSK